MVCPKPGPTAPLPFSDFEGSRSRQREGCSRLACRPSSLRHRAPTRGDAGIGPNGCLPLPREDRRQPQGRNRGPRRAGTRHC